MKAELAASSPAMELHHALSAIDHACTQEEVFGVLRAYAESPLAGCSRWITGEIEEPGDIAAVALELARLRLSTVSAEPSLVAAEAVFARASMRSAALQDTTGAWTAYQARERSRHPASPGKG